VNRFEKSTTAKQIRLERRLPAYWRVTFDLPPLNIFGPDTVPQLNEVITALETDEDVKVVVFDSAVEGFFLTHYDFLAPLEDSTRLPPGPTGLQALPDQTLGQCGEPAFGCGDSAGMGRLHRISWAPRSPKPNQSVDGAWLPSLRRCRKSIGILRGPVGWLTQ